MKKNKWAFLFYAALGLSQNDANDWISYAEKQIRGNASIGQYKMEIVTPQWTRELSIEGKSLGKEKSLVFIQSPAKEKGVGTLKVDKKMTNYFPKLKRTVEISPSMLLTSWMGSDFTNDDLLKASSLADDYNHKFTGKTKIDGEDLRIIENTLKDNAKAVWPKIVYYASEKDYLPRKQEYFDNKGTLMRTLYFSEIKEFDGHKVPSVWIMKNTKDTQKQTKITYEKLKYNVSLTDKDFTTQKLTQ